MRAKVEWMDVDHAQEPMTTVGTGDGSVAIGILTGLVMTDLGDIIATEHLTGMMTGDLAVEDLTVMTTGDIATEDLTVMTTGDLAVETQTATGPGVGAAVSRDFSKVSR